MSTEHLGPTSFQQLVELFAASLAELGCRASASQLEGWSMLVHEAMSGEARRFHTMDHILDVIGDGQADAIQTLAILFHDTIYWQVDGGLFGRLADDVGDVVKVRDESRFVLRLFNRRIDRPLALVATIFGIAGGQSLSLYSGLNEFVSAVLAVRTLSPVLPPEILAQLATCIEATIPFRGLDEAGRSPSDRLAERLRQARDRFELELSDAEVEQSVHRAVGVANRDLNNFASADTAHFLDNTWKLLSESNRPLRKHSIYRVSEYRNAIQKMETFLGQLQPEQVFHSWQERPSAEELAQLRAAAKRNLAVAHRYLRVKLLAAATVEALAELSGGDCPVSLLAGDLPIPGRRPSRRLEHFLPDPPATPAQDVQPEVLRLLCEGRAGEVGFDLKNSPLASLLYQVLGDAATDRAVELAKTWLQGPLGAATLLDALPGDLVGGIAEACAQVAPTRAAKLQSVRAERISAIRADEAAR